MKVDLTQDQRDAVTWLAYLVLAVILFVVVVFLLIAFLGFFLYCVLHDKSTEAQLISGAIDTFLMASFTRMVWFFFGGRSPWLNNAEQSSPKSISEPGSDAP